MPITPSPYLWKAADTIVASHQEHLARVELVAPDGSTTDLLPLSAVVSFDDSRAPRVEAQVTIALPDEATLGLLDPRVADVRLRVYAGYRYDGREDDLRSLGDLGLRTRVVDRPSNTVDLLAQSDEAIVIDAAHMNAGTVIRSSIREAIQALVNGAFGTARTWVVTGSDAVAVSLPVTDTDRWDNIEDLADRANLDVYDDGSRSWFISNRADTATVGTPVHELTVGAAGTVLRSSVSIERRGAYANRVHVIYEWTDASNVRQRVIGTGQISAGAFKWSLSNSVILEVRRAVATTLANANTVAKNIVSRTVTRGRSYAVDAIAAYWLRPGHTIRLTLPTGAPERHVVSRVEYDLLEGTMSLDTRVADTDTTAA